MTEAARIVQLSKLLSAAESEARKLRQPATLVELFEQMQRVLAWRLDKEEE
jgi:hypothetical protein